MHVAYFPRYKQSAVRGVTDRRQTLVTIEQQLRAPEDHVRMAQAYEAYSEIGTDTWNRTTQREEAPAYLWTPYFEAKALEIARH